MDCQKKIIVDCDGFEENNNENINLIKNISIFHSLSVQQCIRKD